MKYRLEYAQEFMALQARIGSLILFLQALYMPGSLEDRTALDYDVTAEQGRYRKFT